MSTPGIASILRNRGHDSALSIKTTRLHYKFSFVNCHPIADDFDVNVDVDVVRRPLPFYREEVDKYFPFSTLVFLLNEYAL